MSSVVIVILGNLQCVELFLHLHRGYGLMELDLQSLFGLLPVYSCTHFGSDRATPPLPPTFGLIYDGAIGQPR